MQHGAKRGARPNKISQHFRLPLNSFVFGGALATCPEVGQRAGHGPCRRLDKRVAWPRPIIAIGGGMLWKKALLFLHLLSSGPSPYKPVKRRRLKSGTLFSNLGPTGELPTSPHASHVWAQPPLRKLSRDVGFFPCRSPVCFASCYLALEHKHSMAWKSCCAASKQLHAFASLAKACS